MVFHIHTLFIVVHARTISDGKRAVRWEINYTHHLNHANPISALISHSFTAPVYAHFTQRISYVHVQFFVIVILGSLAFSVVTSCIWMCENTNTAQTQSCIRVRPYMLIIYSIFKFQSRMEGFEGLSDHIYLANHYQIYMLHAQKNILTLSPGFPSTFLFVFVPAAYIWEPDLVMPFTKSVIH